MEDLKEYKTIYIGNTKIIVCSNNFPKTDEEQKQRIKKIHNTFREVYNNSLKELDEEK